jgi:DNA topoisomerase-2
MEEHKNNGDNDLTIEDTYKKHTDIEHVLKEPDTFIGDIYKSPVKLWVYNEAETETESFIEKTVNISQGFYKIFDEIIVNTIDQYVRLNECNKNSKNEIIPVTKIEVTIDKENNEITITNNGNGIDVAVHKEYEMYVPEMLFGSMNSSANYDKKGKITGGKNGFGAKLTNIFSKQFTVETLDHTRKKLFKQTYRNNLNDREEPIIKTSKNKPYTKINFIPDLERFEMTELDDDIIALMKKRTYDLSACTNKTVNVYFNGEKIMCKDFEKYVNMYIGSNSEKPRVYENVNDRWDVAVCLSPDDKMDQVSFVNGICTFLGGKHVEHVLTKVTNGLTKMIKEKKKGKNAIEIKTSHLKDNMWVFVRSTIEDPSFGSQTKQCLSTMASKFGSSCNISDKFIENVYKKTGIIEKASLLSQYKEKSNASKTDGQKKGTLTGIPKLDDANWAGKPKSAECTLFLTEGDSAKTFAVTGMGVVGRDKFGAFPLKGKILNVRDAPEKKILENDEINNLKKIIGLVEGKVYKDLSSLRYGSISILSDADDDGKHIKGLVMNLIHVKWPSLMSLGFIKSFATPILIAEKGNRKEYFYTKSDYDEWCSENDPKRWEIQYLKGLATSTAKDIKEYFKNYENYNLNYNYSTIDNKQNDEAMKLGFDKSKTYIEKRKKWLGKYNKDEVLEYDQTEINIHEFINKDLIHFSNSDNIRSIPSICDGFKPSYRKIVYGVLKRNLIKKIKVSQLAGYISEHTAYHHGEASLYGSIISLAQDFVGSNNINLLRPEGAFGTRLMGGKDSGAPRYILTYMQDILRLIFNKHDDVILNYVVDEGETVEPEYYLPIIPMILVNGVQGIGTGYSTRVPQYNPLNIITNLKNKMENKKLTNMKPWYRGFNGSIEKNGLMYVSKGNFKKVNDTTLEINELPIGTWTQEYKILLDGFIYKKISSKKEEIKADKAKRVKDEKNQCIISFTENHTDNIVKFVIKFRPNELDKLLEDEDAFEKKFKLIDSLNTSTSNMHLYNSSGYITKYNNPNKIIDEYYDIRLEFYDKRKTYLLDKMQREMDILTNKYKFIKGIVNDTFVIYKKDDDDIMEILTEQNFMQIDDKFDYLIDMPVRSLTEKKIKQLEKQLADKEAEYAIVNGKTIKDLWIDDLDELEREYIKMMREYEKNTELKVLKKVSKIKIKINKIADSDEEDNN